MSLAVTRHPRVVCRERWSAYDAPIARQMQLMHLHQLQAPKLR